MKLARGPSARSVVAATCRSSRHIVRAVYTCLAISVLASPESVETLTHALAAERAVAANPDRNAHASHLIYHCSISHVVASLSEESGAGMQGSDTGALQSESGCTLSLVLTVLSRS